MVKAIQMNKISITTINIMLLFVSFNDLSLEDERVLKLHFPEFNSYDIF